MSCIEHWIGEATPVEILDGEELIDTMKRLLKQHDIDIPDYYTDEDRNNLSMINDIFYNQMSDEYAVAHGIIYTVERQDFTEDGISLAEETEDGKIKFHLKFYNGGACFDEVLEHAITKMKEW